MRKASLVTVFVLLCAGAAFAAPPEGRLPQAEPDGPFAIPPQSQVHLLGPDGTIVRGLRCAAPVPTREEQEQVERELELSRAGLGVHAMAAPGAGAAIDIPVAFHVIYKTDRKGKQVGNVTDAMIDDQIGVLNAAYAGTGFSFTLASVDRFEQTKKQAWFDKCYQQDNAMKNALAISPATTLNIYTCAPSSGGGTLLGYAYLPNAFPESDPRHGVVLLYASLPGGGADPYDEGDTATHEIGHYLGLYHTFQNGCSTPGDSVDDTPYEASAAFGCPTGRDTCSQAGLDPITNFMDYTDDPCMDNFSTLQGGRMQSMVATYKPSL
jgi:hypothetical protein